MNEQAKQNMVTHKDVQALAEAQKWFYTPTVREHFFNPKNIFKTEEEVENYKADGIGMVGSPACTKGETLIHVNFDLQQMDNLAPHHKVLSHDGSYNKITKFYKPKYKGKIVSVKNQFGNVTLTPDHLVYAMQIPKGSSFAHNEYKKKVPVSWVHAKNLTKGDICPYPIPKEVREVKYINIPINKIKWDHSSKKIPTKIKVTKDLLRLFGYFVAEGHTRKGEIGFTFNITERHFVKDVVKILKKIFKLDATIKERPKRNRIDITTNSIHLAKYLRKNCGNLAYNKKIPEWMIFLPLDLQKSFLYGVWHGDGYINLEKKKPRAEYATSSWILAQELKVLLLRQKIEHSIYYEEAKTVKGVNHAECYRIHVGDFEALKKMAKVLKVKFSYPKVSRIAKHSWFDNNYFYMPIRKVEQSNFNGRLHNLEVSKTHSYVSDAFTLHNCGDAMKMWIKVDKEDDRITECKWQTFGCASAIGSTSMLSVMVSENGGMKIEDALQLKPQHIMERLGGLPAKKFHCSVLGDKALRSAINDFFRKSKQVDRIIVEAARIIDPATKVTDKDIEEAVLEGADNLEKVQKKLKVGIGNPEVIPAVEELIRFYREKYFG